MRGSLSGPTASPLNSRHSYYAAQPHTGLRATPGKMQPITYRIKWGTSLEWPLRKTTYTTRPRWSEVGTLFKLTNTPVLPSPV